MKDYPLKRIEVGTSERESSTRFPIRCKLEFKMSNGRSVIFAGLGDTLNMSSSGVLFESERGCPVGGHTELSISWPLQLNQNCSLKLIAQGRLVRQKNENSQLR
jgi:hypothetical protein